MVANGHYHACRVPDIPGLKEWKAAWPSRVQHSKGYRTPNDFKDQVRLLLSCYSPKLMVPECPPHRRRSLFHRHCQRNCSNRGKSLPIRPRESFPSSTQLPATQRRTCSRYCIICHPHLSPRHTWGSSSHRRPHPNRNRQSGCLHRLPHHLSFPAVPPQ